jgi:hypothetical protein
MFRFSRFAAVAALGAVALSAALFAACGEGDTNADREDLSGVISAITIMDSAGLHDIDDSIRSKQTVPPAARTTALKMQAVTKLTSWPEEFKADAETLAAAFGELAAALDGDKPDLAKAGAAAKRAHDVQHDFSGEVWAHLQSEAGVAGAEAGHAD